MALATYHPEMKQAKPAADFEGSLSHSGRHYFVDTRRILKGRGIQFLRTLTASDLVPEAQHKVGTHEYKLTIAAFEALCKSETVAYEMLLD